MSNDPEQEYFSDGMTEDILAHLAKIKDLRVISRTTCMRYKGTDKSLPEIGSELGVDHILEGTVRRAGNQVRIVGQLIKVDSDEHLWAETFDRELTEVFAIQSEVATLIAKAMQVELTDQDKKDMDKKPTENIEAYDYYLKGNEYYYSTYVVKDLKTAIQMYEQAIELDPNFALALVKLASTNRIIYFIHHIDRWFGSKSKGED